MKVQELRVERVGEKSYHLTKVYPGVGNTVPVYFKFQSWRDITLWAKAHHPDVPLIRN